MRRFITALALITGTLVPAIAVSPASAEPLPTPAAARTQPAGTGGFGIRLVDAPVGARDDPRARVYIVDHLAPGAVIHRRIEVSNGTAAPALVELYAAAAAISDGSFRGAAARTPNDLSSWTSLDQTQADLQPGERKTVVVTIAVPADAAPGEQYGVVWSEVRSTPQDGVGVTQVSRVGIRLYVSVGPGGPPPPNFTVDTLTASRAPDGRPMITAAVHNTGGRAIDLSGTIELTDGPGGLSAGPFAVTLGITVAVGDTETATTTLENSVPAGPWTATITLGSGLLEISEQATITFPASGEAAPAQAAPVTPLPAGNSNPGWLCAAVIALAVLLVAGTVLLTMSRCRRRALHVGGD
jgi:hypothetical protein